MEHGAPSASTFLNKFFNINKICQIELLTRLIQVDKPYRVATIDAWFSLAVKLSNFTCLIT